MALLKNLYEEQIMDVLAPAAAARSRAVITVSKDGCWVNLPSQLLAADEQFIYLGPPEGLAADEGYRFGPRETVAVSFKLKHHKYLLTSKVQGDRQIHLSDGRLCSAIVIDLPRRMQRLSRRTFERVEVPANRIVRASFWPGSRDTEPAGGADDGPVFMGTVMNISAGGFSVRTGRDVERMFEPGFTAGVRLVFGAGDETVFADAQCRHLTPDGDGLMVGFQFLGLGHMAAGRDALRIIGKKVSEFQHQARLTTSRSR